MSAGAFAKITAATATGGGNFIRDGIYKFLVEKVHMVAGHQGESFIAELRVMESNPSGLNDEQGRPIVPNAPGSTCSLVCNITANESAAGNAKAFLEGALAGLGYSAVQATAPDTLALVTSEKNPMRGVVVLDETFRGINKGRKNAANAGKPITKHKWSPVLGQTLETVAQCRAWLDANQAKPEPAPVVTTPTGPAPSGLAAFGGATPAAQPAAQTQPTPAAQPATTAALGGVLGGILGGNK